MTSAPTKRADCPKCSFILQRCLCDFLKPIDNKTKIIVLQHPSETRHALGSVHIMKKSFLNMDVFVGEDFSDHEELNSLINQHKETIALIFPTDKGISLNSSEGKKMTHLLFIDGTWKKARKIFLLSKNLHSLPSYFIIPSQESLYKIRKSPVHNGLSTLEASACALEIVEVNLDTSSLIKSFRRMIEFQIEKMGEETFIKNYAKKKGDD